MGHVKSGRFIAAIWTTLVALVLAGCAAGHSPAPTTEPSPSPAFTASPTPTEQPTPTVEPTSTASPAPTGPLGLADLKYALLGRFGPISWCDPDYYPIARQDEQVSADQHWDGIRADTDTFDAITAHLRLDPAGTFSADDRLAVYRDWKLLNAVILTTASEDTWSFDLISITDQSTGTGLHVTGTIDSHGMIAVEQQAPSGPRPCPICLARGTLIATPRGPVAVESLRVGDVVWTSDGHGRRVAAPLITIGSTPVPPTHEVVHLVLSDGREVWVSPGHRLADGRVVGRLTAGAAVDGARVVSAELDPYAGGSTFDILPAGPTGTYWASGILLSSTLL